MPKGTKSYMNHFADEVKLLKKVRISGDSRTGKDFDRVHRETQLWEMEFYANKTRVIEIGKSKNTKEIIQDERRKLRVVHEEKDLRLMMQDTLTVKMHTKCC